MAYIDLTYIFTSAMPVFPGDPGAGLVKITDVAKKGFTDYQIKTGMRVGTHMAAPAHMIQGGNFL